jgi:uncharacterized SAM-binding protein YcdF (DUF218 family)
MTIPGELKTLLTALVLPPAGPILLGFLGLLLARAWRRVGVVLVVVSLAALWLLSCNAVAIQLARGLLPQVPAVTLVDLRRARIEAVVVLGGGVYPQAPAYGMPQPSPHTVERLRYGVRLARVAQVPLAFSGGLGWAGRAGASEAEAARAVARQDFGQEIRWVEGKSRDTAENAQYTAALLQRDRIQRIALVSDAWHLPRATREFQRAGFEVLPAPMGHINPRQSNVLEWLPSDHGLASSRQVIREWIGMRVQR